MNGELEALVVKTFTPWLFFPGVDWLVGDFFIFTLMVIDPLEVRWVIVPLVLLVHHLLSLPGMAPPRLQQGKSSVLSHIGFFFASTCRADFGKEL